MSGVFDPIRLFVGAAANDCDLESQAVLEYSARKHCSLPLEIVWMQQAAQGPWSGWRCESGRTPFTHFRWSVPAVCGYRGRAIYMDSDFIVRGDLAELWLQAIPQVALVRNPTGKLTTSCIVFDCANANGHVPELETLRDMKDAHGAMLAYFRARPALLAATAGNWDCFDLKGYELTDPAVRAIHYTRISSQPQLKHAVPRLQREGRRHWYDGEIKPHPRPEVQQLFDELLQEAAAAGFTIDRYRVDRFAGASRRPFVYASENPRR